MRKNISIFAALTLAAALAAGCSTPALEPATQPQEQAADEAEAKDEAEAEATEATEAEDAEATEAAGEEAETTEAAGDAVTELPAYTVPASEEDPYKAAISDYIIKEFGSHYDKADVSIPNIQIVAEETDDPEDIRVIGSYYILNYDLKGDTLECVSGGSYPGCMHLKQTADGYEVTSSDIAEDGENFTESMKKVCGEWADAAMAVLSDQETRELVRKFTIEDYVSENNLPITKYQDFGWDPVVLFAEEADLHEMTTKIDGCETFTQIVDGLEKGKGYANAKIGDTDVLLVASGTYSYEEDLYAAIDAEIFYYNDGKPEYLGYVECGGTAYPLAVKDGVLYVGNGHNVEKMTVKDGKLETVEEGDNLFDELETAEIVEFSTVE